MPDNWVHTVVTYGSASIFGFGLGSIIRTVWNWIKKVSYRWGYRPSSHNPLYSPSLNLVYRFKDVYKEGKYPAAFMQNEMRATMYRAETPQTLFSRMQYCPVCLATLDEFNEGKKECPRGCGYLYFRENAEGTEAITFEPF